MVGEVVGNRHWRLPWRALPGAVVVHSDDISWHHAFFDWADLIRDGVLVPVHARQAVSYCPPAWEVRGREVRCLRIARS